MASADGAHSWTTRLVEYVKLGVDMLRRAIDKALRMYRLVRQGAGGPEQTQIANREEAARDLAKRLFFEVEKREDRYFVRRNVSVSVQHDNLTLEELEGLLETWKLRGPHGG